MNLQVKQKINPFFEGCKHGKFLLQKCATNGHLQYPPGNFCRQCGSHIGDWVPSMLKGTVEAFSLVQRAPMSVFDQYVPYMVAVVKLTEGPLVETWLKIDGRTPEISEVDIGEQVGFGFEPINGQVVPVATLVGGKQG